MENISKYQGIIPAFYACYDAEGNVSPERVRALTEYHIRKGVKGVYVNGSSGECIYQSVEDKIDYKENVVEIEGGNHAQFGNYGPQEGDLPATISAEEQQAQTVEAISDFIAQRQK